MAARSPLGRTAALGALWRAVRGARRPGGPTVAARVRSLPRMVAATLTGRYHGLGAGRLGLLVVAALYVVSPVDLVPELVLPLIGVGDDALVLAWLAGTALVEADRFLEWEAARPPHGHVPAATVTGHVVG